GAGGGRDERARCSGGHVDGDHPLRVGGVEGLSVRGYGYLGVPADMNGLACGAGGDVDGGGAPSGTLGTREVGDLAVRGEHDFFRGRGNRDGLADLAGPGADQEYLGRDRGRRVAVLDRDHDGLPVRGDGHLERVPGQGDGRALPPADGADRGDLVLGPDVSGHPVRRERDSVELAEAYLGAGGVGDGVDGDQVLRQVAARG